MILTTAMMGRWWIHLFLAASKGKVETVDNSEPTFDERSITGNRIVDMELFAAVIHMSGCPFCSLFYRKIMEKRKNWHHC